MSMLRILLSFLWALMAVGAAAQQPGQHVTARIDIETSKPAPGRTATLAFVMSPSPGWHDYWINPGDAGGPLTVEWSLPQGVTAKELRYPVPTPLIVGGFMNHVYKGPHAILADLAVAPEVKPGTKLPVKATAYWFACSDSLCVPEKAEFAVELVAGDSATASAARFDTWRAAIPSPLDRDGRYAVSGKSIALAIPFPRRAQAGPVWFFPATKNVIQYAAPQRARRSGDWLIVETALSAAPTGEIEGLLRIGEGRGLWVKAVKGKVPDGGVDAATMEGGGDPEINMPSLPLLLLGALFGGLLLNIMPCVFPILGLKALSLAKAGGDEADARRDALAYSAGVIVSCLALGGLLLGLRAGGEQIGWAFQLQHPVFVLFLLLLMTAITANLAGLFELGSIGGALQPGTHSSFGTGVLSALVATPCTGPFMAAAMGAALLLPTASALLLFAALGLGLALPFLLLGYVPWLRRLLPRPGPWLLRFRQLMAVPMGLTVLALLWLLYRLAGWGGFLLALTAAVVLLIILMIRNRTEPLPLIRLAMVLGLITFAGSFALRGQSTPPAAAQQAIVKTQPFSESRLAALRQQGRPVFLYFTADWCITCKVNEANAIQTEATKAAFARAGVDVLEGDYTRPDPAIAGFLTRHGRSGVPLYLYYAPGKEGQELPQLLTPGMLADRVGAN
jgi:DsbC/DsbD-like thiol-disulfide interchange protein/cytochrome c biogenesis protein CcdA